MSVTAEIDGSATTLDGEAFILCWNVERKTIKMEEHKWHVVKNSGNTKM